MYSKFPFEMYSKFSRFLRLENLLYEVLVGRAQTCSSCARLIEVIQVHQVNAAR